RSCREKWKRTRATFYIVDKLAHTSGPAYSEALGANIGIENHSVWDDYMKKNKDAGLFWNKGWPLYKKMKSIMPSNARGAN
ncbi:hypothetical protein PAXRUDRAFT_122842, partial [Paxillus rubicundulus Ve08.2h10]